MQVVDATTESHIYQVKLRDSLVSSLQFARAKNAELAWLDGEIATEEHLAPDGTRDESIGEYCTRIIREDCNYVRLSPGV